MTTKALKSVFSPNFYEESSCQSNYSVCGVDEVGRGCLAGPVVTAAVILKPHSQHELIQDSKLLTPKERTIAYNYIKNNSISAVSFIHHRTIDTINIYQATLKAMKRSVTQLLLTSSETPAYILVDAMPLKLDQNSCPVIYFPFGEKYSTSIAAASIVAKVTRDALMTRLETLFPGYSFISHKGYGTKKHKESLSQLGTTVIHRTSFLSFLTS